MGLFGSKRKSWPTAIAKLDEIGAGPDGVDASGCFTVNGEYYSVQIHREFLTVGAAEDLVRELERNPNITVRFNPADPSENEFVED